MRYYAILIILVVIAFANSLQNSFLLWDDVGRILRNSQIDSSLKEIPSIFLNPLWKSSVPEAGQIYYRPMGSLLGILNYKIWGPNPSGFHLTNILLHLTTAIFVYRVGLLLFDSDTKKELISLIAASIFAVHPVHNEAIGRPAMGESLYGLFIILTLYFFLRERRYLSWITFFLSLLSKEAAVMLPFALVILSVGRKGFKKGVFSMMPYVFLVIIYLILRAAIVDSIFGVKVPQPIFIRILTMSAATWDYIRLLLIPFPLSPFYPARWYTSILEPKVVIAIFILLSIAFLTFKLRKNKVMIFLLTFPFIMLAPVIFRVNAFLSGLDQMYIAERFLYVPIIMFSFFVSVFAVRLAGNNRGKIYLVIGWLLVTMIFVIITISSTMMWKDDFTIFSKIARETPDVAFAHNGLGSIYYAGGQLNKAIEEYLYAINIKPDYAEAHYNLANSYLNLNYIDKAIWHYQTASRFSNRVEIHTNLCIAYRKRGLLNEAVEECLSALRLKPDHVNAHYNLGITYWEQGNLEKALNEYKIVLRLDPNDTDTLTNIRNIESLK